MPAPSITKASFSNVLAALKENGLTPVNVDLRPDGTFSIDVSSDDKSAPALATVGPKKWGERKAA